MLCLVSYDLRLGAKQEDYLRIADAISRMGGRRVLLSQWVVRVNASTQDLRDVLLSYLDANDRLLVTEIGNWASLNAMVDLNAA